MNNKFKELADKANAYTDVSGRWVSAAGMNKFAELIVKECSNVAWQHTPETEELEYSHLIKDKILEHFGVEE